MTTTLTNDPIADAMMAAHRRRIEMGYAAAAKIEGPVKRPAPRSRRHSVSHRSYR